jgi:large subunit ribosomal protein L24
MKIKKGDKVKILIGKDKGKIGEVEKVFTKAGSILVPGVNEFKRHVKSRARNQKSEIMTITKPVPVSNSALICPKCNKPTRVGYRIEKGKKLRICRKCKKAID